MNGDHDEVVGKLSEELADAMAIGEVIDAKAWAARFQVSEADVLHCQRGLGALLTSLGEELAEGHPELPQPQLPSDFEVVGELGRGGMGVVYRARQRSLDREVAIKVLRPGDLVFGDALRRFRAEARSLARLRHRHIVSVYDSGETPEGLVWFAMDLVDGRTLADELKARGRMMPARATKIIRQVTSAIAHAHAQGIVHRDLKPQNVLIDAAGDAFVVDFGLARDQSSAQSRTMSGELLGTPAYMSPEQARGDSVNIGETTDVWALGTLLYEMLVGSAPYAGKPLHETIRAILHDEPPSMRRGDKKVPQGLELVCGHALQKRPEDRYPGALAFGEDVERFQDGRGVLVERPSKLSRMGRALKRRWRLVTTIAAAVLVTLAAVAAWLPSLRRDAVVQEAKRLVATGHPGAAIESLQAVLDETPNNASNREELEFALVQALNDRAGDLLVQDDLPGALEVANQALPIASKRATRGGVILIGEFAREQQWRWQLARASAIADRMRGPQVPMELLQADLQSQLPGRRALARRAATLQGVELSRLQGSDQLAILRDNLRQLPHALDDKSGAVMGAPPYSWTDSVHECWSPALEDELAVLATAESESVVTRAFAFHMWARAVGLPTYARLKGAGGTGSGLTAAQAVAAASTTIAKWRLWRSLPREEALQARIDLLVDEMMQPGAVLPGASFNILGVAQDWTGHRATDANQFREWWQVARSASYQQLLKQALGLPAEREVSVLEALDTSAMAPDGTGCLWRQLAWLQVPDGVRIPEAHSIGDSSRWRTACLRAAEQPDDRTLTARLAVLRFDDGSCEPELVVQCSKVVHIGVPVQIDLRGTVAESSWLTLREAWEDELDRQQEWVSADVPMVRAAVPAIGEVTAALRGEVRIDRGGVRLHSQQGDLLRHSLPWMKSQDQMSGVKQVWAGTAAAIGRRTVQWDMGQRITHLVMVVALHETSQGNGEQGTSRRDPDLAWWHRAIARSFEGAGRPGANTGSRTDSADWLSTSLWPTPSVAAQMQLLSPDWPEQRMAMALAGSDDVEVDWAGTRRVLHADVGTRLAVGSASKRQQARAVTLLTGMYPGLWTPRTGQTLREAAAAQGTELPPELTTQLGSLATPDGIADWLSRDEILSGVAGVLIFLLAAWGWMRRDGDPRRNRAAWLALALFWLLFVRVKIGGVILTPSFVVIFLMMWCVARAGGGRSWWRIAGLSLFALIGTWAVGSWFFGIKPPFAFEIYFIIAGLVAAWTPKDQLNRQAAQGLAQAREQRRRQRSSLRVTGAIMVVAFVGYAGLQVLSGYMSHELLTNAELRVVDPSGKPVAGVQTFITWARPSPYFTGAGLPVSDRDGYVDLSSMQHKVATLGRFDIEARVPGHRHEPCLLERSTTIVVPEVGSLVLQMVDADGKPWRDLSNVHSDVYSADTQQHQSFDADGRATFPVVACGKIRLGGRFQASELLSGLVIDGPSRAGETKVVNVTIPLEMPRLIGVITKPDGTALHGNVRLAFRSSTTQSSSTVTTDAAGRFRFLTSGDPSGGTVTLHVLFGEDRRVRVPESAGPMFDVGTVVLEER